jgi:hypothetical protein
MLVVVFGSMLVQVDVFQACLRMAMPVFVEQIAGC